MGEARMDCQVVHCFAAYYLVIDSTDSNRNRVDLSIGA
jgi:hypothetical protein